MYSMQTRVHRPIRGIVEKRLGKRANAKAEVALLIWAPFWELNKTLDRQVDSAIIPSWARSSNASLPVRGS